MRFRHLLRTSLFGTFAAAQSVAFASQTPQAKPKPIVINLSLSPTALDMAALQKSNMGFMPNSIALSEEKPRAIAKEPAYRGKPKYGAFTLGNGPHSITYFAVDEAKGEKGHVYIDKNQNGDLTDDGSGEWNKAEESKGVVWYESTLALRASWGSPVKEEEGGEYTLFFYKRHGDSRMNWTKFTARSGKLEIGGKTYAILLAENTSDALFTVPKSRDRTRRPVQLMIDLDGDGSFKGVQNTVNGKKIFASEVFSLDRPFALDGSWWDALPSLSGAELVLAPTAPPNETQTKPQEPIEVKELLAAGTVAPNFTAQTPTGKPIQLSNFKGKIVLLDFWATWCGPCIASMPGLQKIYDQAQKQGVVVFSVNVFDEKEPFDAWIEKNASKPYTFTFAFDPAGRDNKKSIAAAKYNVTGIPTLYVIGRDGKVSASIVGSGNESAIVRELAKHGVTVKAP